MIQIKEQEQPVQTNELGARVYNLTVINTPKLIGVGIVLGALFLLLLVILSHFETTKNSRSISSLLGIVLPLYLLYRFFLKKYAIDYKVAELYSDKFILKGDTTMEIPFSDIEYYKVEWQRGAKIFIALKSEDVDDIELRADSIVCNSTGLENFATDFNAQLTGNKAAQREQSFTETPVYFLLLIGLTLYFIWLIASALQNGKYLPWNFYVLELTPIIVLWSAYFNTRRKLKNSK